MTRVEDGEDARASMSKSEKVIEDEKRRRKGEGRVKLDVLMDEEEEQRSGPPGCFGLLCEGTVSFRWPHCDLEFWNSTLWHALNRPLSRSPKARVRPVSISNVSRGVWTSAPGGDDSGGSSQLTASVAAYLPLLTNCCSTETRAAIGYVAYGPREATGEQLEFL